MNKKCLILLIIGYVNVAKSNITYSPWVINEHLATHMEQKQRADGTWEVQGYHKKEIGYYEKGMQGKATGLKFFWGSVGGMVVSCVGACAIPQKNGKHDNSHWVNVPVGLCFLASIVTGLGAGIYILNKQAELYGYQKEYIAKDSGGKPLDENYEYYRLYAKPWQRKDMPITAKPTIATIPYEAAAQIKNQTVQ